jgi:fructosamine-3-kinase
LKDLFQGLGAQDVRAVSGGCIHQCYRATIDGRARFIKVNDARFA